MQQHRSNRSRSPLSAVSGDGGRSQKGIIYYVATNPVHTSSRTLTSESSDPSLRMNNVLSNTEELTQLYSSHKRLPMLNIRGGHHQGSWLGSAAAAARVRHALLVGEANHACSVGIMIRITKHFLSGVVSLTTARLIPFPPRPPLRCPPHFIHSHAELPYRRLAALAFFPSVYLFPFCFE